MKWEMYAFGINISSILWMLCRLFSRKLLSRGGAPVSDPDMYFVLKVELKVGENFMHSYNNYWNLLKQSCNSAMPTWAPDRQSKSDREVKHQCLSHSCYHYSFISKWTNHHCASEWMWATGAECCCKRINECQALFLCINHLIGTPTMLQGCREHLCSTLQLVIKSLDTHTHTQGYTHADTDTKNQFSFIIQIPSAFFDLDVILIPLAFPQQRG